jgi:glycosyltransferase involved in cell wall biosynthesis
MSEALERLGHEIHIVTYHLGRETPVKTVPIHRIPRIPTYRRYSPGPTYQKVLLVDPVLCWTLTRVVRARRIDLIHAHHFEGALVGFAARALTGRKVIYDAHTTLQGELEHYPVWLPRRLSRYIDRRVPQAADHVIAVSGSLRDFLRSHGTREDRITVIPTGVDLEDFERPMAADPRARLGVAGAPLIVYTGGLAAFQGVSYLLLAMRIVSASEPAARLLIASADTDVSGLQTEATALGISEKILYLPGVTFRDVPELLACADVAVIPRVGCPGMPQKLTNYMASGRAVVSFRGSGKLLEHGVTGLLVADGDVEAFAGAILRLLRDRRLAASLGAAAREAISRQYGWQTLARQVEGIYRTLLPEIGPAS